MSTWGEQQPDGSVNVISDDSGVPTIIRNESWNTNQGITAPAATAVYSPGSFSTGGGSGYLPYAADMAAQAAQQQYLRDRLNNLEIPMSAAERAQLMAQLTGYYTPAGGGDMTDEQALDYIWKTKPDLAGFFQSNGWDVSTPEKQRAAARNWIDSVDPANRGKTPQQVAQELGAASGAGFAGAYSGQTGALPTFARDQFNAANQQWMAGFLGSKSGPRDYALYSQLQPKSSFGAVQGSPSWEQSLASFWNTGSTAPNGGATTSQVGYRQPTSLKAGELNTMTPTDKAMRESEWSYNGLDPNDMWTLANRSRPTGNAAAGSYWR